MSFMYNIYFMNVQPTELPFIKLECHYSERLQDIAQDMERN